MALEPHCVMFHHFCGGKHPKGQGAISASGLHKILDWLQYKFTILDSIEYQDKFCSNSLGANDICLTFDDALLSQYEISRSVLIERELTAFYFIYSAPFFNVTNFLEIFRYFRTTEYAHVDDFYADFFLLSRELYMTEYEKFMRSYDVSSYLAEFGFYSENDKKFRYLRDVVLGQKKYEELMLKLMDFKGFDINEITTILWMTEAHVSTLAEEGNVIGLHSFSHPTQMHQLSKKEQTAEYQNNYDHLYGIIKSPIITMSHPCGNYDAHTLEVLSTLGIAMGFRSNVAAVQNRNEYEIPREDHINILRRLGNDENHNFHEQST
jgi:hypothetical protein